MAIGGDASVIHEAIPHGATRVMLRKRLQHLRATLQAQIDAEADELATAPEDRGEDTTASQHPADVASDLERRELLLAEKERRVSELRDVEAAIERMDRGTYGRCVDCGGQIPEERLNVLPDAARDAECARAAQRGGR